MNQEYLTKLKKQLGELTLEEELLRDLYLRGLANGEIQGPPVGYSSIDKQWLKYYSEEDIKDVAPNITCYENLYLNNKEHLNDIAIEYYGNKITYKQLFENIEKAAQAYQSMGVKSGDIVTICSITTPEVIYSFYALNKIGAISNMIDVRYTKKAIESYLNEVNSKYFVTLDLCYPKIKDIVPNTSVEKVITIAPTNSVPPILKAIIEISNSLKKVKNEIPFNDLESKYIDWNDFINTRKNCEVVSFPYTKDYPLTIVHTGGTTGVPKGGILTNENFNNATLQIKHSSVIASRGYKFLNIMPPFIAYGIVLGINAPITLGWHTIVVPQFDANKFDELLLKHKPNGIMGVPTYWETVMKSNKMKNKKLPFIKNILLGGDRINPEFETRLATFLKEHESDSDVGKGYSMTEASACATFSSRKANELDSVGIPLVKTTISVFEPQTTKELRPYEIGEICIKTPTMMKSYYDKEEDTKAVKVKHDDGYWIHSGDLGYIDKNGIVFHKDRIKRMIARSGFKVFPSEIENLFITHYAVESCAVVGIPDEVDVTAPIVHLVLKKEYKGCELKTANYHHILYR